MPKAIDLTGRRFGKLVAIRHVGKAKHGQYLWGCKCDCGNTIVVNMSNLRRGHTTSCGCILSPKVKDRFHEKIKVSPDGCWIWTGQLKRGKSVGLFWLEGKTVKAKDVAWELYHAKIPDGYFLKPTCGNTQCVNPDHLQLISKDSESRFWSYVDKKEPFECWEWQGAKNPGGYGTYLLNGEYMLAHRASWVIHNGPIEAGLFVCHRCDNPPCVNPDHLFLGTNDENVRDMVNKGRQKRFLTEEQVLEIRSKYQKVKSQRKLAKEYGVSRCQIRNVIRGVTYKEISDEDQ